MEHLGYVTGKDGEVTVNHYFVNSLDCQHLGSLKQPIQRPAGCFFALSPDLRYLTAWDLMWGPELNPQKKCVFFFPALCLLPYYPSLRHGVPLFFCWCLFLVFDATEMADLVIGCRLMGLDPETIWVQLGLSAGAFCILSDDAAATSEQATTIKAGLRQISAALLRFYQGIPAVPAAEKAAVEANVKVTANYLLSIAGMV